MQNKIILLLMLLILTGCKPSYTTVQSYSLKDSTALEFTLPSRSLVKMVKAEQRTARTKARKEAKTEQTQIKQEAKTGRVDLRQNKAIIRALAKKDTRIAKQEQRSIRAIPNALKWASIALVVLTVVFLFLKSSLNKLF